MTSIDQARLSTAVTAALEAFWASIAQSYPEATSGDLDIGVDAHFDQIATATAGRWVQNNVRTSPVSEAGQGAPQWLLDVCRRVYDASNVAGDETDPDAAIEALEDGEASNTAIHHSGGGTLPILN